jgi:PAS domain S-box-containing protein
MPSTLLSDTGMSISGDAREGSPSTLAASRTPTDDQALVDAFNALRHSEACYRAALQAGRMGSWETNFRSRTRVWTDEGLALFGIELADHIGKAGGPDDEWLRAVHPLDRNAALAFRDKANHLDTFSAEYRIIRPSGDVVWLAGRGQVIERDEAGKPLRLVNIVTDITDRKLAERALHDSEVRFRSIFENVAVGIAYTELDGRWIQINEKLCDILGYSRNQLLAMSVDDLADPADRGVERREIARIRDGETAHSTFDIRYRHADGSIVWIGRTISLVDEGDGTPRRFVSVYRDVSERRRAQERQRFLLAELSHRSKNLLAVIQSLASRTIRSVGSLEEFEQSFMQRLKGIAASQDVLVHQNWSGGDLRDLVTRQLALFGAMSDERISIAGPAATLEADPLQAIGLALHELATNAAKYGSLSTPTGHVAVTWAIDDATGHLNIDWIERGGPPVSPPQRTGFGTLVLDRMVSSTVEGSVRLTYEPSGFEWRLTIPPMHFHKAE